MVLSYNRPTGHLFRWFKGSVTRRPNILQQLLHQNYTGMEIRLRHWGMSWWSFSVNCTLVHTGVWGECALWEAENFVFLKQKSCIMGI